MAEKTESKSEEIVVPRGLEEEMKQSYIDYAMSVIIGRALPDVRDGLKPVHRRILYAMYEMGNTYEKPHKKCARIVGEVLGKYHPHGDAAVYDALVRMAQDFSLRYPLIDGQGNFGSMDGDSPAAMRYTECRLAKIAESMLADIEKETVSFRKNFDGTLEEPTVLPAKLPNLIVNGSSGIAVGMATNIPPHNLSEIIDGIIMVLENKDVSNSMLQKVIRGPDFPTGGIIYGVKGITEAYATGKGTIRIRAKINREEDKGRKKLVITELPYLVNKAELLTNIARLVKERVIDGIVDLRDESSKGEIRIVIELRKDAIEDVVVNQLYAHTQLESSFGIICLALVNGQPKILSLRDMLNCFIEHRTEVLRKRAEFDLKNAKDKEHILNGLIIALDNIDKVVEIIRNSKTVSSAKTALMKNFALTEKQATAILEMRLQKLISLEVANIKEEFSETKNLIAKLTDFLAAREKICAELKKELLELKAKYGDKRRTEIVEEVEELELEDLIPVENVVVMMTSEGYIKRLPISVYKAQKRGGKGLIGMTTKECDYVNKLFATSTHDYMLFFTNKGRCYWLKTYKIPEESRYARGRPIVNLLSLRKDERVTSLLPVKEFDEKHYLIFATKKGIVKKTSLFAFRNPREKGIFAIKLSKDDELIDTSLSTGNEEIILATANGFAIRFDEKDLRQMGRAAGGVRGIKLTKEDSVVSMALVRDGKELFTITEYGYGKKTRISSYRKIKRGGKGVYTMKITPKNGKVVAVREITPDEELIVTSKKGMVIRIPANTIPAKGRRTMGVRVMRLSPEDKVTGLAEIFEK